MPNWKTKSLQIAATNEIKMIECCYTCRFCEGSETDYYHACRMLSEIYDTEVNIEYGMKCKHWAVNPKYYELLPYYPLQFKPEHKRKVLVEDTGFSVDKTKETPTNPVVKAKKLEQLKAERKEIPVKLSDGRYFVKEA